MKEKIHHQVVIKKLDNLEDMMSAYPLISQMYDKMDFPTYKSYVEEMVATNDFKMVAAFLDEKMVGVSGYWVFIMLYCGRYLQVSNLVVDREKRSLGVGKKILAYLEEKAKKLDCQKIVLDSYTENKKSHSLYYREGFYIRGFHFMKDL